MRTLFLCLSIFFFSATPPTNDLVGAWVITTPDENGDPITWEMTFTADGAYFVDVLVDGSVDIHGKYWIDGKQIIPSKTMRNVDAAMTRACTNSGLKMANFGWIRLKTIVNSASHRIRCTLPKLSIYYDSLF